MTEVSAKMLHVAHRVPGMFGFRQNVEARGLVSYGVDIQDQIARGHLCGPHPERREAGRSAALRVAVPQAVLMRADKLVD